MTMTWKYLGENMVMSIDSINAASVSGESYATGKASRSGIESAKAFTIKEAENTTASSGSSSQESSKAEGTSQSLADKLKEATSGFSACGKCGALYMGKTPPAICAKCGERAKEKETESSTDSTKKAGSKSETSTTSEVSTDGNATGATSAISEVIPTTIKL